MSFIICFSFRLFGMAAAIEAVDIHITALATGSVAEDGVARAHEETLIVETHLVVGADAVPLLSVEAVIERCHIASQGEISIDAQPNSTLLELHTLSFGHLHVGHLLLLPVHIDDLFGHGEHVFPILLSDS